MAGCVGGEEAPNFETLDERVARKMPDALRSLCRSADAARRDDIDRVRDLFIGDAHQFTHDLATVLNPTDPAGANQLLIAVSNVESELFATDREPQPQQLATRLDQLVAATRVAAERAGLQPPPCP
jgi:hypothetical protein